MTLKDPRIAEAAERAIARLRYGTVGVNSWAGFAFAYASPPWGGYPGSEPADIQSGTGWVHNTSMLEGIEKAVLRHPLTIMPKPATFPSHRTAHTVLRRLTPWSSARAGPGCRAWWWRRCGDEASGALASGRGPEASWGAELGEGAAVEREVADEALRQRCGYWLKDASTSVSWSGPHPRYLR